MATWIGAVGAAAAAALAIAAGGQTPPTTTQSTPPPSSATTSPAPTQSGSNPSSPAGGGSSGQTGSGQSGQTGSNPSSQTGNGQSGNAPSGQSGNASSGQMGNGQMGSSPSPSTKPTTQATPKGQTERISVPLQTMPQGTVTLNVDPRTHLVHAQLNMLGLAPGTQHRVVLSEGRQTALNFPDVTVDASGRIQQTVTSTQPAMHGLPQDLSFQVDLLPSQTGGATQQQIAVARRQVGGTRSGFRTFAFQSTIAQPGHAQLSYDPATQKLTVTLQVSGLAPGSAHAAHIHSGSCAVQGAVLYPLPDLVANRNGTAFEQTTITVKSPPPASGWYVNVHDGNMNNILQANGQPGPLFQPLVCGNVHPTPTHS